LNSNVERYFPANEYFSESSRTLLLLTTMGSVTFSRNDRTAAETSGGSFAWTKAYSMTSGSSFFNSSRSGIWFST